MSKRVLCLIAGLIVIVTFWPLKGFIETIYPTVHAQPQEVIVEQVVIRLNRRIPESTIRIWISTREGDPYNPAQLDRDVRTIYAQGYFDDVRIFAEDGTRGGKIVTFEVKERPLLLEIKYVGLKSVQQSTVLEEFRKRQVGLSKESQYDPVKAKRAAAVIKELLGNEGRPEAKVEPVTENISNTAVSLTFKVDEGPRFRVAEIEFEGNNIYSDDHLKSRMKYVKQIGLLTTFSSKDIYNKEKLQADLDRLRVLTYVDNGYLQCRFGEPRVEQVGKVGTWVPLFGHKGEGLKLIIPVTEGRQYRAGTIKIQDNKEFTEEQIKSILNIKPGDIVRGYTVVNKGIENLKKLYGSRGYIQFDAGFNPEFQDDPNDATKGTADVTFVLEEGKQYTLRRLEFIGNTFTRDNVLRREVLLNEGERYNKELFDYSILRLNQLGYFEQVKDEDATINTNERDGLVDITMKVQEKGRQQISFTGGVSGIGGSFIGIDYSTNNLLGYGESLSLSIAAGNRQKVISLGFSEPYLRGRPISVGFNVFYQNYQFFGQGFNQISANPDLFGNITGESLFTQRTAGFSVSASAPLSYFTPRFKLGRFTRLGLSYTYQNTDIIDPPALSDNDPTNDFPVTFRQKGVRQSKLTPTFSYNTLNNSLDPTDGSSFLVGASLSGSILGGDVNTIEPTIEFKRFRPFFAGKEASRNKEPNKTRTLGFRVLFGHISAFGKRFESNSFSYVGGTPIFNRFFLGGEESIRGYNIRSISPTAPIRSTFSTQNVYATDLSGNRLKVRPAGRATTNSVAPSVLEGFTVTNQASPAQTIVPAFTGGDTQLLVNLEYRIPIIGPLTFAPFIDIGSVFNLRKLDDQFITSEFVPTSLNSGIPIILNTRGLQATQRELTKAGLPESPGGLPPGFKYVNLLGDQQDVTRIALSEITGGVFKNYRTSMGGEFRIQVPVINVPFRLIFAYNPNARTDTISFFTLEKKFEKRFSIGRTF
jgi:outer membrane protein insertion porin family